MKTVEERVAAGARWLDKHNPSWADNVDVLCLDLASDRMCVLGQVYGSFRGDVAGSARFKLTISLGHVSLGIWEVTNDRGFNAYSRYGAFYEYEQLRREWRRAIELRQTKKEEVNGEW